MAGKIVEKDDPPNNDESPKDKSPKKKDWGLTKESFELLLTSLNPDRNLAVQKYNQIQNALLAYFEYNMSPAADLTEATFNEVARSLQKGKKIYTKDPAAYFYGVARNILRQWRTRDATKFLSLDDLPPSQHNRDDPYELLKRAQEQTEHERRLNCLKKSLAKLAEREQALIMQYYEADDPARISYRKGLAERLGISPNVMRVKAMRIRDKLYVLVKKCLSRIR